MVLLSFLEKENRLSDKKFSKLTMVEAKMCNWMCLEAPHEASKVIHDVLGLNWRTMPFKSVCEILELRFGDVFFDKNKPFDFDTWNMLYFLGSNLNDDQRSFLRENNFLPHKYTAAKEELEENKNKTKRLEISIVEFKNANQVSQIKSAQEEIDNLQRQQIALSLTIKNWEEANPDGGNPADALEYIDNYVDLRQWLKRNESSSTMKTQMFDIIISQMSSALSQVRNGKKYTTEDFGHHEEGVARIAERKRIEDLKNGKGGWFSFGNKKQKPEPRPFDNASVQKTMPKPPVVLTNTMAASSKAIKPADVLAKAVAGIAEETTFTPKPEPIKVDNRVEFNPKPTPELRKMKTENNESPISDYDRIQKRVMDKKKQTGKEIKSSSKSRIIVIGIIVVAALAALYYFT